MAFLDIEFPRSLKFHSLGGPRFSTQVNQGFGGAEQRNQNWAASRGKWSVSLQTPSDRNIARQQYVDAVVGFFRVAAGKANAFRFWDAKDHSLIGQVIGIGDGATTVFQLKKTYLCGGQSFVYNVTKPVWSNAVTYLGGPLPNSIQIAVNGAVQAYGSVWTLDPTTGLVTFGTAPVANAVITTPEGDFHFPVRFDTDELPMEVEESYVRGQAPGQGPIVSMNGLPLVEVFPPNY